MGRYLANKGSIGVLIRAPWWPGSNRQGRGPDLTVALGGGGRGGERGVESWGDGRGEGEHVDGGGRRGKGGKVAAQAEGLEVQQMCLEIFGYPMDSLKFGALEIFENVWNSLEIFGNPMNFQDEIFGTLW